LGGAGKVGSKIASTLKGALPEENMVIDKFKKWGADPSKTRTMLGSMLGASLGGAGSAALGTDEGMQADFINAKAKAIRRSARGKRVKGSDNGV
jgi:predicted lipid-binding transport protein (Tim44 family)